MFAELRLVAGRQILFRAPGHSRADRSASLKFPPTALGGGRLTPKERQFARDMTHRLVCGSEPTERQANWLRAISAEVGAEAHR
jgi:hypothetical protein